MRLFFFTVKGGNENIKYMLYYTHLLGILKIFHDGSDFRPVVFIFMVNKCFSMLHVKLNSPLLPRQAKENVLLGFTHIKNVRTGYFAISHELTVYKWTRHNLSTWNTIR